jgi:hypothetical protein
MSVVTYLDIRFQILALKKIYLFTTLLEQQKITAKYSNICYISSQFCPKKEVLFLKQNRPEIQRISAYFSVIFFCFPNGVAAIKIGDFFYLYNYKNYKEVFKNFKYLMTNPNFELRNS